MMVKWSLNLSSSTWFDCSWDLERSWFEKNCLQAPNDDEWITIQLLKFTGLIMLIRSSSSSKSFEEDENQFVWRVDLHSLLSIPFVLLGIRDQGQFFGGCPQL